MKKIVLLLVLLLGVFNNYAQGLVKEVSPVVTTVEEYDYLTKVLPKQDNFKMMPGYKFEPLFEKTIKGFTISYQYLVKNDTKETKAVFIKITKLKKKEDKIRYLCLPFNNAELIKKYIDDYTDLGFSMYGAVEAINVAWLSQLIDIDRNLKNKS